MIGSKTPVTVEYKTLVFIWSALLASQLFFVVLILIVKPALFVPDLSRPLMGSQPLVTLVFAIGGIAALMLGFVFRNQHMARAAVDHDASCVQTGLVLAFSEACSLLGVILALAFNYQYFWVWIGLGIIGILFHFPRRGNLHAAMYKSK